MPGIREWSRRRVASGIAISGLSSLAGCLGENDGDAEPGNRTERSTLPDGSSDSSESDLHAQLDQPPCSDDKLFRLVSAEYDADGSAITAITFTVEHVGQDKGLYTGSLIITTDNPDEGSSQRKVENIDMFQTGTRKTIENARVPPERSGAKAPEHITITIEGKLGREDYGERITEDLCIEP